MDDLSLTLEASTFMQDEKPPQLLGEVVRDNDKLREDNERLRIACEQLNNALNEVNKYKDLEDKKQLIVDLTERCRVAEAVLEEKSSLYSEEKKKMTWHIENITLQNEELKREVAVWKKKHSNAEIETKVLSDKLSDILSQSSTGHATFDESEKVKRLEEDLDNMKTNYEGVIENLNEELKFSKANIDCLTIILTKFFEKYNIISKEEISNFGLEKLGIRKFLEEDIILSCGGKNVSTISTSRTHTPLPNEELKVKEEQPPNSGTMNLDETINMLSKTMGNISLQKEIDMNITQSGFNNFQTSLLLMKELLERMFEQLRSVAVVIIDTLKGDGEELFKELNDLMLQIQISVDTTIHEASVLAESINQSNLMNLTKMMNQTIAEVGDLSVCAENKITIDSEKLESMKIQTEKLKEETNELREKLSSAMERLTGNNAKLFEQTTKLRTAEEQIKTFESSVASLEEDKKVLAGELLDIKAKYEDLKQTSNDYAELLLTLNNERDALLQDIESKNTEVEMINGQNESLRKEVEEIRKLFDDAVTKLQEIESEKENVMSSSQSILLSQSTNSLADISRSELSEGIPSLDELKKAAHEGKHYIEKLSEYAIKKEAIVNDANVKHVLNNMIPIINKILMRHNIVVEKISSLQNSINVYLTKVVGSQNSISEENRAKLSNELKAIVTTLKDVSEKTNKIFSPSTTKRTK
uniref:GRIP domain-containing protein n=1 Tax=Parastrongyloides trichosuri TaxID=131310 RepID=A0A0N4ZPQ4_PARTI